MMGTHTNCHHIDALERYFGTCPPESRSTKDIVWKWECSACAEVADICGQLTDCRENVRELQAEWDALHGRLGACEVSLAHWQSEAHRISAAGLDQYKRRSQYRARALALLERCRQNRDNKFWAGECGSAWGALELEAEQMDKYPTLAAAIVDQITVAIDTGDDLLNKAEARATAAESRAAALAGLLDDIRQAVTAEYPSHDASAEAVARTVELIDAALAASPAEAVRSATGEGQAK